MSDLSKIIVTEKENAFITLKIFQIHPNGSVWVENDSYLEMSAFLLLYELAVMNKNNALSENKSLLEEFGGDVPYSTPEQELMEEFIRSVQIIEISQNDNWEKGPFDERHRIAEDAMPYVILKIEMQEAAYLDGLEPGTDLCTASNVTISKWL